MLILCPVPSFLHFILVDNIHKLLLVGQKQLINLLDEPGSYCVGLVLFFYNLRNLLNLKVIIVVIVVVGVGVVGLGSVDVGG